MEKETKTKAKLQRFVFQDESVDTQIQSMTINKTPLLMTKNSI